MSILWSSRLACAMTETSSQVNKQTKENRTLKPVFSPCLSLSGVSTVTLPQRSHLRSAHPVRALVTAASLPAAVVHHCLEAAPLRYCTLHSLPPHAWISWTL